MTPKRSFVTLLFVAMLTTAASFTLNAADTAASTDTANADATKCKRGCNKKCEGAANKSKCVGSCRRACDGN